jgi:NAD(P)-dependent dehydrogenase (short-subunit alcohol dehydrogenase family)
MIGSLLQITEVQATEGDSGSEKGRGVWGYRLTSKRTGRGVVTYAASKAALLHFTSGLTPDLRGLPIRTTLVELGPIPTDVHAGVNDHEPTAKAFQRLYRTRLVIDVPHRIT